MDSDISQIVRASRVDLRETLLFLCRDPKTRRHAVERLDKLKDRKLKGNAAASTEPKAKASTTTRKRKAPSPSYLCTNCDKTFDEDSNGPKACVYHPGKLCLS